MDDGRGEMDAALSSEFTAVSYQPSAQLNGEAQC